MVRQRRTARTWRSAGQGVVLVMAVVGSVPAAQSQNPPTQQPSAIAAMLATTAERSAHPADLTFFNRRIVTLRARVLGREPLERAAGADRILDNLVHSGVTGPVDVQIVPGGALITLGSRLIVAVTPIDVDELSGETLDSVTADAARRLQQAVNEAVEARTPRLLLRRAATAAAVILLAGVALWVLAQAHRAIVGKLVSVTEQTAAKVGLVDLSTMRSLRVAEFARHMVTALITLTNAFVILGALTMVLRQFPYTRPWGESISGFLLTTAENLSLGVANALPGLFTVAVIFTLVHLLVRVVRWWFNAVERGHVRARWIHPDTAQPTRRLMTTLLWIFGVVVAYPYLPGSQTDAFKGVSVFLGLMLTFGSSGLVSQITSGFMVTYSRALRVGDFVRIGDVEGTVTHLGVLSAKIRTLQLEEVTIPNAVVVSTTTTDFSRYGDTEGVYTPTSVTIGYDTPWRQVEAMLLIAVSRTAGIRTHPKPLVLQAGLEDYYVKYTLFICLEHQQDRPFTMHALHANIQDAFNEYGVQIMSPNYVFDPSGPKIVPKERWFDAPAQSPIHPQGV